jgi:hypothetical protein
MAQGPNWGIWSRMLAQGFVSWPTNDEGRPWRGPEIHGGSIGDRASGRAHDDHCTACTFRVEIAYAIWRWVDDG